MLEMLENGFNKAKNAGLCFEMKKWENGNRTPAETAEEFFNFAQEQKKGFLYLMRNDKSINAILAFNLVEDDLLNNGLSLEPISTTSNIVIQNYFDIK